MRFSFSTGTFYHRGLGYSLDLARATGYDGVEYALSPHFAFGGIAAAERAEQRSGVPVLSIHPPFLPWPGWPRSIVERLPRVTAAAAALGAPVAVVHPYAYVRPTSPRAALFVEALRRAHEAMAQATDGGAATTLTIENSQVYPRRVHFPLDSLATLVAFAGEHDCGLTLDTCHVGANREDLLTSYATVRPLLRNIHLSDMRWVNGKPRTHLMPGEGELPLREFLATLARDGYDGLVTLELHPRYVGLFNRGRAERRLRQALDFMRSSVTLAPTASGQ